MKRKAWLVVIEAPKEHNADEVLADINCDLREAREPYYSAVSIFDADKAKTVVYALNGAIKLLYRAHSDATVKVSDEILDMSDELMDELDPSRKQPGKKTR